MRVIPIAGIRAHTAGASAHHGLGLAVVLVHVVGISHGRGDIDLRLLELLAAHARHVGAVREDLGRVVFVFGVLDQFLVLAGAALADAAEGEDGDAQEQDAAHDADDDVFGRGCQAVPLLLDALSGRLRVLAVEFEGRGFAARLLA